MSRFASAPWPAKAAYVVILVLAAAIAFAAVAGLVALAGLHRLSPDLDPVRLPGWFWYFRGDPQVRRWLGIGSLAALGLSGLVAGSVARGLQPSLHGKARWASEGEIRRAGLRGGEGLVLGRARGRFLVFSGPEHVLLYAPTRTGKGVGLVIPNLLNWPRSVVVLDVKRENWDATAGFRAAHGQQVILFDPLAADGSTARYNPLDPIDRRRPVLVLDELQRIAAMLFPPPAHGDAFWSEAARTGFIGVGALVAESSDLPFTLGEIFRQLTTGEPRTRLAAIAADRAAHGRPLSTGCATALADFCAASDNTFASIRQTITARLGLWLNPLVDQATASSDFDLRALKTRPMSLYLAASPENLDRIAPLYALILQQLVDTTTRSRPDPASSESQVLVLLDEFARLGHAGVIAHAFSFIAGYGLRFLAVLQSPAQLRAQYGPDLAEEIITNCGVEVVFAPKDIRAAQTLSERLGFFGLQTASLQRPAGMSAGRRSRSESEQRRALLLPQELLTLPQTDLMVLRAGTPPIRGRKIVYYRERVFQRRVLAPPPLIPRSLTSASLPTAPARRVLTPDEYSGRTPLTAEQAMSSLDAADLDALPEAMATVDQLLDWTRGYVDRSALEASLAPSPGAS